MAKIIIGITHDYFAFDSLEDAQKIFESLSKAETVEHTFRADFEYTEYYYSGPRGYLEMSLSKEDPMSEKNLTK